MPGPRSQSPRGYGFVGGPNTNADYGALLRGFLFSYT